MIFAICAAVLASAALWILSPILGWGDASGERHDLAAAEREDLLHRRQEKLSAIKDLEMEYRIGKLSKEDFEETRERLAGEAVEVLKAIDARGEPTPRPAGKHAR
ncbi:MAG: hypothetical protein HY049_09955 [Acidobacteria bacterium]|nr:hypothetical protein [Acidobacteriota bacterium]